MNNKRRITFASILAGAMAIDMISTFLMVESGYRELTGLILLMINTSYLLLALWVVFWWCLVYFLYPVLEKINLTTHLETIALWYGLISLMAGIGNFYLYYHEVIKYVPTPIKFA